MTETRAVLLGFAGMAVTLVLGAALFVWGFVASMAGPPPDAAETQAVNQVFDAKKGTFDPVRGLERVLPTGLPWSKAETLLAASRFDCKASETGETCTRGARMGPCQLVRRIEIGLGRDRHIASTLAVETPNCL